MHFLSIWASFWEECHQKSSEMLDAILEVKKGAPRILRRFFGSGPAECAGSLGRIMEGYENQFRQRIEAENQGGGKELSSRI